MNLGGPVFAGGETVASGDKDGTVCLWNPHPHRLPTLVPGNACWRLGHCIALSPDGGWLAANQNDHHVELSDIHTMRRVHSFTNMETQLGFIRDGKQLLLVDKAETPGLGAESAPLGIGHTVSGPA